MPDTLQPAMEPAPGQLVTDQVRLVRLLGKGGMGSVWLARHEALDIDVAVKFVSTELLATDMPLVLARFRREAQLAARLDDPHTVRIFDHGVSDSGAPYIVMELLRGQSLAERLHADKRIALAEAVSIVRDVAEGLEHAHKLGVIHRDIKPPNIFLARTADDRLLVKILDFGIAKSRTHTEKPGISTSSGVLIGTPHYMSPEQLMRAGPPDASADVWALAVVAYEILIGKPPFVGETLAATLVAITKADLAAPSKTDPGLSTGLDRFFSRALSVDIALRYGSARALAEAFAQAAAGAEPSALPTLVDKRGEVDAATMPTAEFLAQRDRVTTQDASQPQLELAPTEPGGPAGSARQALTRADADTPLSTSRRPPGARATSFWSGRRIAAGVVAAAAVVAFGYWLVPPPDANIAATPPADPGPLLSAAEPVASASPAPSVSTTAPVVLPLTLETVPRTAVAQGVAPLSSVFVAAFEFARETGDENLPFTAALRACERRKMSLCSEAQWQRACEQLPLLGTRPSWTLSPDDTGIVVRGGRSGCSSRTIELADTQAEERIGACCSRGIGTTSANANPAFLTTTGGKVLNVERLLNAANGSGLAQLATAKSNFFGRMLDHNELAETAAWMGRGSTFYFDSCEVAIRDVGDLRGWTGDCVGVKVGKKGDVHRGYRWISFADGGLMQELREPKGPTLLSRKP